MNYGRLKVELFLYLRVVIKTFAPKKSNTPLQFVLSEHQTALVVTLPSDHCDCDRFVYLQLNVIYEVLRELTTINN